MKFHLLTAAFALMPMLVPAMEFDHAGQQTQMLGHAKEALRQERAQLEASKDARLQILEGARCDELDRARARCQTIKDDYSRSFKDESTRFQQEDLELRRQDIEHQALMKSRGTSLQNDEEHDVLQEILQKAEDLCRAHIRRTRALEAEKVRKLQEEHDRLMRAESQIVEEQAAIQYDFAVNHAEASARHHTAMLEIYHGEYDPIQEEYDPIRESWERRNDARHAQDPPADLNEDNECPICFADKKTHKFVECGHAYCELCCEAVRDWIPVPRRNKCPLCRGTVTEFEPNA